VRIPSLDGLRAISIATVVFGHMLGTRGFFGRDLVTSDLANLGVRVFFVVSGFLITSLLLAEIEKTGRVSLRDFYVRRVFRIFPAFYAYLAVLAVAALLVPIPVRPRDLLFAATYTTNYVVDRSWYTGHLWSLSVEEQFYLLWPAALLLLPAATAAEKRRKAAFTALAVILLAPFARAGTYVLLPDLRDLVDSAFHTVADAIAFGCLLACVHSAVRQGQGVAGFSTYVRFLGSRWFFVVPLAILVINRFAAHIGFFYAVGTSLLNLLIAVTVDRAVRFPDTWMGRVLNAGPLRYVGLISYSIYLWQQPFLNRASDAFPNRFPQNLVLATICALLSYYLVEQPMLRLREHRSARARRARQPAASAAEG
jgi:peptidoglycan/LPS O-acetylase OafA/YrhL